MASSKEQIILLSVSHNDITATLANSLIEKTALICHGIMKNTRNSCEEEKTNEGRQLQNSTNLQLFVTGSTYISTPGKSRSDWETGKNWTRGEEMFKNIVDRIGISCFSPGLGNSLRLDGKLIDFKSIIKNDSGFVDSPMDIEPEEEKSQSSLGYNDDYHYSTVNIQQIKEFTEIAQRVVNILKRENSFSYTSKVVVLFPFLPQLGSVDCGITAHLLESVLNKVWAESNDSNEQFNAIETIVIPVL